MKSIISFLLIAGIIFLYPASSSAENHSKSVQQISEVDQLVREGKYAEALEKYYSIKNTGIQNSYYGAVLNILNHKYDIALEQLNFFVENIYLIIDPQYVGARMLDDMNMYANEYPLYSRHLIYDTENNPPDFVVTGLDLTILKIVTAASPPFDLLKKIKNPTAPFAGDGIILKAFVYELLKQPEEAKKCLSSSLITKDFDLFNQMKGSDEQKTAILKQLKEHHENDKLFKEYSVHLDNLIAEMKNTPQRKQAIEWVKLGNEKYKNREWIAALYKFRTATMLDSTVLIDEGVKRKIDFAENEVPEIKLKNRSDGDKVLDQGKIFLDQNKNEEALYCFGMLIQTRFPFQPRQVIELWNSFGQAQKNLGNNADAEKAFQMVKDYEQKLKENPQPQSEKRRR